MIFDNQVLEWFQMLESAADFVVRQGGLDTCRSSCRAVLESGSEIASPARVLEEGSAQG